MIFNIFIDKARGGFGDIYSGILLSDHLKSIGHTVYITAEEQSKKTLSHYREIHEVVDTPRADVVVGLSTHGASELFYSFSDTASVRLGYYEYSQSKRSDQLELDCKGPRIGIPICRRSSSGIDIILNSGANSSGIYIGPRKSSPPMPFAIFCEKVKEQFSIEIHQESEIFFSYSKRPHAQQLYLKAVDKVASDGAFVFCRKFSGQQGNMFQYDWLDHDLFSAFVYYCSHPPLVTGDVSFSLVVDYEKFFFYEVNPWKSELMGDLLGALASGGRAMCIDALFPDNNVEEICNEMVDKSLHAEFRASISERRSSLSLANTIVRHADFLLNNKLSSEYILNALVQDVLVSPSRSVSDYFNSRDSQSRCSAKYWIMRNLKNKDIRKELLSRMPNNHVTKIVLSGLNYIPEDGSLTSNIDCARIFNRKDLNFTYE
jgi:hypothetical protein